MFNISGFEERLRVNVSDIRDKHSMRHLVKRQDVLFNLAGLLYSQMVCSEVVPTRRFNVGGGPNNAMSLKQLTEWCATRFGTHKIDIDQCPRPHDIPWVAMDNNSVEETLRWRSRRKLIDVLTESAAHADQHTDWIQTVSSSS